MTIGERLHEERRRLNLTQSEMGKIGSVAYGTYANYEKGIRYPDADCLANLYAAGVDVLYVVTGARNNATLSNAETMLLEGFNRMDERGKAVVQAVVQTYNTER